MARDYEGSRMRETRQSGLTRGVGFPSLLHHYIVVGQVKCQLFR